MKAILIFAAVLASTITGNAATLLGKNLTYCDSKDPKEAEVRMLCWGYVSGFVEGIQMAAQAAKVGKPICIPTIEPDANGAAVRAIIDYEEKQQKHRGEFNPPAPDEAAMALIAAFPCRKPTESHR